MNLPEGARERMVRQARQKLNDRFPEIVGPPLPLAPLALLVNAEVMELGEKCDRWTQSLDAVHEAASAPHSRGLESSADNLAEAALELAHCIAALGEYAGPPEFQGASWLDQLKCDSLACLDGSAIRETSLLPAAIDAMRRTEEDPDDEPDTEDLFFAAYGIPGEQIADARGVRTAALLIAEYHGKFDELIDRTHRLTARLTVSGFELTKGIYVAMSLLCETGPLSVLVGRLVKEHLLEGFRDHPDRVSVALRELHRRADISSEGAWRMMRTSELIAATDNPAERAGLMLERYRQFAEGQLRPWGWALLRIAGHAQNRMPELGSLRTMLLAQKSGLHRYLASGIYPEARNAAAHEDYEWSSKLGALMASGTQIALEDVDHALELAMAGMYGAEVGWAAACAESPALQQAMVEDDGEPVAIRQRHAVNHFGRNGLRVIGWRSIDAGFRAVLEDLPSDRVNQCMQALVWCSQILPEVEQFQVIVNGTTEPAISVARRPLQETFALWCRARAWFVVMPTSVFLAVNTASRLEVEASDAASRAVAWMVLDDVASAFEAAFESRHRDRSDVVLELGRRLQIAVEGARLSLRVTGQSRPSMLHKAIGLLEQSVDAVQTGSGSRLQAIRRRLMEVYAALEQPAILPTWNKDRTS
jgi:hypothetical protein